jgi:hypothetical protein
MYIMYSFKIHLDVFHTFKKKKPGNMSLEITNMKSVLRFAIDTEVKVKVAGEKRGYRLIYT